MQTAEEVRSEAGTQATADFVQRVLPHKVCDRVVSVFIFCVRVCVCVSVSAPARGFGKNVCLSFLRKFLSVCAYQESGGPSPVTGDPVYCTVS